MNHWCTKKIYTWSHQKISLFAFVISVYICPKSDISGALGPIHYITLKAFAMALGGRTKCKTCFGCPRMVLCVPWKTLIFLQKLSLVRGDPPPPVWWIIRLFTWFFLWYLPLLQMLPSDTPTWQIWALIWTNLWKFCCSIGSVNPLLTQNYIFLRYQTNLFYMDRCITFQK